MEIYPAKFQVEVKTPIFTPAPILIPVLTSNRQQATSKKQKQQIRQQTTLTKTTKPIELPPQLSEYC